MKKLIRAKRHSYIAKPQSGQRALKKILIFGAIVLGFIIIFTVTLSSRLHSPKTQSDYPAGLEEASSTDAPSETNPEPAPEPEPNPEPAPEPEPSKPASNLPLYQVLSVIDGDTIRINYHGVTTSVRLIGINTPETVDSRTVVQCFGREASNYLKAKLTGKQVSIEADPTQSDRDIYDRLLRYVYLDGEDVGLSIIANGYGHEYTYAVPYQKQSEYKSAERKAEAQNLGLWSPSTCGGDTTQPAR